MPWQNCLSPNSTCDVSIDEFESCASTVRCQILASLVMPINNVSTLESRKSMYVLMLARCSLPLYEYMATFLSKEELQSIVVARGGDRCGLAVGMNPCFSDQRSSSKHVGRTKPGCECICGGRVLVAVCRAVRGYRFGVAGVNNQAVLDLFSTQKLWKELQGMQLLPASTAVRMRTPLFLSVWWISAPPRGSQGCPLNWQELTPRSWGFEKQM
jgi:hypothetical protein